MSAFTRFAEMLFAEESKFTEQIWEEARPGAIKRGNDNRKKMNPVIVR